MALRPARSILLAGGLGGIGALWAQHLSAETLLLLGRRPAWAVQQRRAVLQGGASVALGGHRQNGVKPMGFFTRDVGIGRT